MNNSLKCTFSPPSNYRIGDILAFHKRDKQKIAEHVGDRELQKGIVWLDLPACLTISFTVSEALVKLEIDGDAPAESAGLLHEMARRMLGFDQNIEKFEATFQEHPQLGGLISERRGLRVPVTSTPFEALTWAITQLLAIPGIGPWTVNYALLRGFGYLDGSLHGDVAVRRGMQTLFGSEEKINDKKAETWLEMFSPWRALIAAHIWAAQSSTAY
jgi:3-methyladenine DNA glycosylase/8-oxoguanine DNA glycosylase